MTLFYEKNGPDQDWRSSVRDTLTKGVAHVEFEKNDGQIRHMKCTLDPTVVPPYQELGKTTKIPSDDVQAVWDIEKAAWRSFRFDRVRNIRFEG
jgi:hypothetical protein